MGRRRGLKKRIGTKKKKPREKRNTVSRGGKKPRPNNFPELGGRAKKDEGRGRANRGKGGGRKKKVQSKKNGSGTAHNEKPEKKKVQKAGSLQNVKRGERRKEKGTKTGKGVCHNGEQAKKQHRRIRKSKEVHGTGASKGKSKRHGKKN